MNAFEKLISMRSVRDYHEASIPDEIIDNILEAGRWAGSSKNSQPWNFIVVKVRNQLNHLAGCGRYSSHLAKAALVVAIITEESHWAAFDAGRCAQNMMLAAWEHGIGSCVVSLHYEDKAREVLDLPKGKIIQCAISFGYRGLDQGLIEGQPRSRVLQATGRKPLVELVHWEKW